MMGYFKNVKDGMTSIATGMRVTLGHLKVKANTELYPFVEATQRENFRGELFNNVDDCIGCMQCSTACPVDCIDIETIKAAGHVDLGVTSDSSHSKKKLHLAKYDINMAKCCYCGLCVNACPTSCLVMTDKFDYATPDIDDMMYHFSKMAPEEIQQAHDELAEEKKQKAAEKARQAAEAKAKKEAEAKAAAEAAPPADEKPQDTPTVDEKPKSDNDQPAE